MKINLKGQINELNMKVIEMNNFQNKMEDP
jgi:hypothetical protein